MATATATTPPLSRNPTCEDEHRFHHISTDTEWIESYHPGGYHPVHLGATLKSGQYKIIRKLGYGAFSTVWLARDSEEKRFTALKILTAHASQNAHELAIHQHLRQQASASASTTPDPGHTHIVPLLDTFTHDGPNGTHLCLVLPLMGPSTATMIGSFPSNERWEGWYPPWAAKRIAKQVLQGLDYLHRCGVVHTDLQPGNILFSLPRMLDPIPTLQTPRVVRKLLAEKPLLSPHVERLDGRVDPWAPGYLAVSQPLTRLANIGPGFVVRISDLGAAQLMTHPRATTPVTPAGLRAPELLLPPTEDEGGKNWDTSLDIWAFGCLLFEWVTATPLFAVTNVGMGDEERDDDHLLQMGDILGPLPKGLKARWGRWEEHFDEDGNQRVVPEIDMPPLEKYLMAEKHPDMSEEEAGAVGMLLRSILQYEPAKRPTTSELLKHEWFKEIKLSGEDEGETERESIKGWWQGVWEAVCRWFLVGI